MTGLIRGLIIKNSGGRMNMIGLATITKGGALATVVVVTMVVVV